MAANSCFAFAPNNGYLFSNSERCIWRNINPELQNIIVEDRVEFIYWTAFGPEEHNFFCSYMDKAGELQITCGRGIPERLANWIRGGIDKYIKVSLGPNGSFFAWTSSRVRWHNIPENLEKSMQDWLSPTGWKYGPPRIVSLGPLGSYFALSYAGVESWHFPTEVLSLSPKTQDLIYELKRSSTSGLSDVEVLSLSSSQPDIWLLIENDLSYIGCIGDLEALYSVLDGSSGKEKEHKAEASTKKEETRGTRTESVEEQQRNEKEREDEEWSILYWQWQNAHEDDVRQQKFLTTFPHLPVRVLFCKDVSCKAFKEEHGSLHACQHDVERFLRASGLYDHNWLKKERLAWHPDRFGQRCDPDYRKELTKKAGQLFQILEELIQKELDRSSREEQSL